MKPLLETDDKLDVLKSFVDKNTPLIANITDSEKRVTDSVNELWKQHSALDNRVGQLPSMKDIRAEYVQKTIAQQSNEHLNEFYLQVSQLSPLGSTPFVSAYQRLLPHQRQQWAIAVYERH
jgi:hypothetical protein